MKKLHRELLSFIIAGSINTLVSYSLFCLFIFLGLNHIVAITLSFCCGVIFSFQTIGRFVFRARNTKILVKFMILYISLYFFNVIFLEMLKHFSANWYLNGLITTIIAAALSFIINKLWVFRIKEPQT